MNMKQWLLNGAILLVYIVIWFIAYIYVNKDNKKRLRKNKKNKYISVELVNRSDGR